jgi:hypothetical protein
MFGKYLLSATWALYPELFVRNHPGIFQTAKNDNKAIVCNREKGSGKPNAGGHRCPRIGPLKIMVFRSGYLLCIIGNLNVEPITAVNHA